MPQRMDQDLLDVRFERMTNRLAQVERQLAQTRFVLYCLAGAWFISQVLWTFVWPIVWR